MPTTRTLAHEQHKMMTSVETGKNSNSSWTPEEDRQLVSLLNAEATWPLVAITLGRDVEGVQERARTLGHKSASGST
jgi:hypothetical protein